MEGPASHGSASPSPGTKLARWRKMKHQVSMKRQVCPFHSARSAPPARSAARSRTAAAGRTIRLCIGVALACVGAGAMAEQADAPELPVAEHIPDSPPAGIPLAPGLTFSGYGTVQLLVPDHRSRTQSAGQAAIDDTPQFSRRSRLDLSHLSGIVWWEPSPAWKVLGEVDLQDVVQVPAHADEDGTVSSSFVALDRLYVDYHVTDSLSVRGGKFLTPIGRWNQEHSDPLVWTVLRPLISQSAFPTSATGLMAFGSVPVASRWIDYQVYAADGGEWRPSPHAHVFDRAVGARLSTSLDRDLQLGVSLSRFGVDDYASTSFTLVGIDGAWSWRHVEFSGEAIMRHGNDGTAGNEHGWFGQAVAPIADRWWGVARVEAYRRASAVSRSRTALLGLVYKSERHWVFKVEWARASGSADGLPSGLLSSVTLVY
jgi:hypothetical protein